MSEWKLFAQGLNWDPSITSAKKRDENLSLVTRITHKAEERAKTIGLLHRMYGARCLAFFK